VKEIIEEDNQEKQNVHRLIISSSELREREYLTTKSSGITLERVRRVHPHPLKSDHGCAAPVLKWPQTSEETEYLLFLTKSNVTLVLV